MFGGSGNDTLSGGAGDDVLEGQWGNDVLSGGDGHDTFVFTGADDRDTITDFSPGDTITLDGFDPDLDNLRVAHQGNDTVITYGQTTITVQNTDLTEQQIRNMQK